MSTQPGQEASTEAGQGNAKTQVEELQEQLRQLKQEEERRADLLAKYPGDPLAHLAKLDAELEQVQQPSAAEKRAAELKAIYAEYGSEPEQALLALHQALRRAEHMKNQLLEAYVKAEVRATTHSVVSEIQRDIFALAAHCGRARSTSRFGLYEY